MAEAPPFEAPQAADLGLAHVVERPALDHDRLIERLSNASPVTVVVPVYNGGAAVARCLEALSRWTSGAQVLVIDDASTAPETIRLLDRHAAISGMRLVRHEENWGYTRTANHGMELAEGADVVLLNSDTVVGPMWLQRLRWVAYSMPGVASVTAASNNAGAMSLPATGTENAWPHHLTWAEIARHVAGHTPAWAQNVPTAHGFCAYFRRSALDLLGCFDAEAFPRGYGEENDWSMRAAAAGLVSLYAPHVLVKHARNQSFGEERQKLVSGGRAVVDRRWPHYTGQVRGWLGSLELRGICQQARAAQESADAREQIKPRRLYVLHRSSGGTPATNLDLMQELESDQETYVLENVRGEFCELFRVGPGGAQLVERWKPSRRFLLQEPWRPDYAAFVARVLIDHNIELVHVRHLIHSPVETLPEVCRRLGVPFVYSTHDFHAVCPTVQLLDESLHYCGGVCTPGESNCTLSSSPLNQLDVPLKNLWVHDWRSIMSRVMAAAEAVVATTPSAGNTLLRFFPEIEPKLRIIEHGRDIDGFHPTRSESGRKPGPMRVMAPAMWAAHKGTEYLRALAAEVGQDVEWHILGEGGDALLDVGVVHGEYSRSTIQELTAEIDPDVVGLFSIWAETYAHTLTEAWAMGVPVLVTDLGAPAERVRAHGGGRTLPVHDVKAAAELVRGLAAAPDQVNDSLGPVSRRSIRTPLTMANDYRDLYLTREDMRARCVGVVVSDRTPAPPLEASGAWTLRRCLHHEGPHVGFQRLSPEDYIAGHSGPSLETVLVVNDALPAGSLGAFLERARANRTRVVVEVDEQRLPSESRPGFAARGLHDEFVRLCHHADAVLATNQGVAERLTRLGVRSVLVERRLDERLWSRPVPAVAPPRHRREIRLLHLDDGHGEFAAGILDGVPAALSRVMNRPVVIEILGDGGQAVQPGVRRLRPRGRDHAEVVTWVREHRLRWTAAVEPLAPTEQSQCAGDEKLLEYAMLELPVVASDRGGYASADPTLAFRVDDGLSAWVSALKEVLTDPEIAQQQAEEARHWVLANRMMSGEPDGWLGGVLGGPSVPSW